MTEGLKQICEIVADLRRQGITLTVEGDRLRATPPGKLTVDIVALVKPAVFAQSTSVNDVASGRAPAALFAEWVRDHRLRYGIGE